MTLTLHPFHLSQFLTFWSTWITDEFPRFRRSKNRGMMGRQSPSTTQLARAPVWHLCLGRRTTTNQARTGGFLRHGMGWDGSPKWWLCKGNPLISGKSGLVKIIWPDGWDGMGCRGRSNLACWWHLWHLAGVKLPGLLSVNGQLEPITVLECVLRWSLRTGRAMKGDFNWHDVI